MIRMKFYGLEGQDVVTAEKVLSSAVMIHQATEHPLLPYIIK